MLYKKSVSFTFSCYCSCKGISLLNISNLLHFRFDTVYFRSSTLLNYHHFACYRPEFEIAHLVYLFVLIKTTIKRLTISHTLFMTKNPSPTVCNTKIIIGQEWHTVYVRRHCWFERAKCENLDTKFHDPWSHFQFVRPVRSVRIDEFFYELHLVITWLFHRLKSCIHDL